MATYVNIPRSNSDQYYRYRMPILLISHRSGEGGTTYFPNLHDVALALVRFYTPFL